MTDVVIVGCGVVGAAIAYELSQISSLSLTVLDSHPPAQASTGAALGVLMGIVSHKTKGRAWHLRQASIRRYETLIPELEAKTGRFIGFNPQGILMLCLDEAMLPRWQALQQTRQQQGWPLEIWDVAQTQTHCPQIGCDFVAGIYSPQDRQVDPAALTLALVEAAQQNGVCFEFGHEVIGLAMQENDGGDRRCRGVQTRQGERRADQVILSAGLGSTPLAQTTDAAFELRPVLGQAVRLRLNAPLGDPDFQPVITGNDIHLVPLGNAEYWVGATVEFSDPQGNVDANPAALQQVMEGAIALFPALAQAEILHQWSGQRPRPQGRSAPVIEPLSGCQNVFLATGHYRNGVLLAPATALAVRDLIMPQL